MPHSLKLSSKPLKNGFQLPTQREPLKTVRRFLNQRTVGSFSNHKSNTCSPISTFRCPKENITLRTNLQPAIQPTGDQNRSYYNEDFDQSLLISSSSASQQNSSIKKSLEPFREQTQQTFLLHTLIKQVQQIKHSLTKLQKTDQPSIQNLNPQSIQPRNNPLNKPPTKPQKINLLSM